MHAVVNFYYAAPSIIYDPWYNIEDQLIRLKTTFNTIVKLHETSKIRCQSATADSCFGLIGPRQCSAALGGQATSTVCMQTQ